MRYNEQKLTNKSRIYYHGTLSKSTESDENKANFPWYFITTSFMYAIRYARKFENDFGAVRKYVLNQEIDVFNAQSDYDLRRLKNSLRLNEAEWEDIEDIIVYRDWTLLGESKRKLIADTLKKLGYQGFFNYEATEDDNCRFEYNEYYTVAPSIGLFDKSVVTQIEILTPDKFESESKRYKEAHKRELEYKIKTVPTMIEEGKSEEEVLEYVYQRCPTLRWEELQENKKIIMMSYYDKIFREVYREACKARKRIDDGEIDWFGNKLK
nr:hypothetical protein [Treponema sp.]